jgi:hypothetical protein
MSAEQRQNDVPRDTAAPSDPTSRNEVVLGNRLALSVEEAGALPGWSGLWSMTVRVVRLVVAAEPGRPDFGSRWYSTAG